VPSIRQKWDITPSGGGKVGQSSGLEIPFAVAPFAGDGGSKAIRANFTEAIKNPPGVLPKGRMGLDGVLGDPRPLAQ
jgi:hypothetical protein